MKHNELEIIKNYRANFWIILSDVSVWSESSEPEIFGK